MLALPPMVQWMLATNNFVHDDAYSPQVYELIVLMPKQLLRCLIHKSTASIIKQLVACLKLDAETEVDKLDSR